MAIYDDCIDEFPSHVCGILCDECKRRKAMGPELIKFNSNTE